MIVARHKVELAEFDFELENKSVTSYVSQSQNYFQRKIYQKPVVRSGSDHLANSLQNMSHKGHTNRSPLQSDATILKSEADFPK